MEGVVVIFRVLFVKFVHASDVFWWFIRDSLRVHILQVLMKVRISFKMILVIGKNVYE